MKMRKNPQIWNSLSGLIYQVLLMLYSFVMPRLYLTHYGSEINGLVSSITSFLSVISLMDMGIGAVIQSNFYKPLADKDMKKLSELYSSANKFFKTVVLLFIIYLVGLAFIYPYLLGRFDWFTISLIFILAINLLADYMFGVLNQCLLSADRKIYIPQIISSILIVLNGVLGVILIENGFGIHVVKLVYSLILSIKPIYLYVYVIKHYKISKKIKYEKEPIEQKWHGVLQHLTFFVTTSTDTVVLTIFSTLENVSVYYIYNLVAGGVKQIILAATSGIDATFGHLLAKNETELLTYKFKNFEWIMHNLFTFCFGCTAVLITDFVMVYTASVTDADYNKPLFGIIFSLAIGFWCLRNTYYTLIKAAGHYKQTELSSLVEMIINLVISIIGVKTCGLIGVAFGTLAAMMYRTVYFSLYIRKIINYRFVEFLKHCFIDFVIIGLTYICKIILFPKAFTFITWIFAAIFTAIVSVVLMVIANYLFYKESTLEILKRIQGRS